MKTVKMKTTATLVAQIPAGIEIDVLVDEDGVVYIPAFSMGGISTDGEETTKKPTKKVAAKEEVEEEVEIEVEVKKAPKGKVKIYTEEEVMEMSTDELSEALEVIELDADEYEGRNTHKKLRNLLLEMQDDPEEEVEEEVATTKGKKSKKAAAAEEELIDVEDLKMGDEVSVWWANFEDWFDGEVVKIKGKKVFVLYEDGETDFIDTKVHTKIKIIDLV